MEYMKRRTTMDDYDTSKSELDKDLVALSEHCFKIQQRFEHLGRLNGPPYSLEFDRQKEVRGDLQRIYNQIYDLRIHIYNLNGVDYPTKGV